MALHSRPHPPRQTEQMESFPPLPIGLGPGQRALAAIMFTDVVGFSARMQVNEESVLALLERDFTAMKKLCQQHSGAVLKNTGDGLLLYFPSAVQAVACALRVQKYFAQKAKSLPPEEILSHRVGIHLGDVFLNNEDVMGDGVNIAARLPAEAEPGGICISQTVYDVVKNKLALQVTLLGPRDLKNIAEAVPVYRILLEAQAIEPEKEGTRSKAPTGKAGASEPAQAKTRMSVVIGGLAVIGLLVVIALPGWRSSYRIRQEQARLEANREALIALLDSNGDSTGNYNRSEMTRVLANWRDELRADRSYSFDEFDFSKLEARLTATAGGNDAKSDIASRRLALARMKGLFAWIDPAMKRYSKERPLIVSELSGAEPRKIEVFAGRNPGVYVVEGGAIRWRNWANLKPAHFGAIVVGILLDAPALPPPEIAQGVEIFALFHSLPEMDFALRHEPLVARPTGS